MNVAKILKIDSVSHLDPLSPLQISPDQTIADAVALMRNKGVGSVLVCQGPVLQGIFTERDLMRRVLASGKPLSTPVSHCMTPNPETVGLKVSIAAAVRLMERGGYRHLPVVDEVGRPISMVTVKRIMSYLAEHFPTIICNQPPDPDAVPLEREGA
jgi:CBS domain-containing protein